jgi:uncharacterized RDD family membrane protein YckC
MTTTTATASTTTAGLLPRFFARAVDGVLLAAVGMAVGAGIGFGWTWFVFQLVLVAAYFIGLDVAHGATLGKRLLGLRVVAGNGDRKPTVAEAAKREAIVVLGAVPFVGPVLARVGFSAVAVTIHRGDAVHDRFAGTDVVRY